MVSFDGFQGLFVEVAGVQAGFKVAFANQELLESFDFRVISQAKVKVSFKGLDNGWLELLEFALKVADVLKNGRNG